MKKIYLYGKGLSIQELLAVQSLNNNLFSFFEEHNVKIQTVLN